MEKKALLSVDLNNVTSKQRKIFYEKLEELKWTKLKKLTTVWKASFKDKVTEPSIVSITKSDVKKAAKFASISDYDAVVQVGDNNPIVFK